MNKEVSTNSTSNHLEPHEGPMDKCENCGNVYDKAFQVTVAGKEHTFDCFECAINILAPQCSHCSTRIIGHGVESDNKIFCCAHCAKEKGVHGLRDHAD